MRLAELSNAFEAWFQGSKVVKADGTPLLVYHGTPHGFSEFDPNKVGEGADAYGSGYYYTPNPEVAHGYAIGPSGDSPNIRPSYLAIKRPLYVGDGGDCGKDLPLPTIKKLIISSPDCDEALTNFGDIDYEGKENVLRAALNSYKNHDYLRGLNLINTDFYRGREAQFLENCIKSTPYDGVIVPYHEFYIAWSPKQIMSYFDRRIHG